jgi:zinc protease
VFGETSPLYKELVLDEQKVVMLSAEAEAKRDPGLFGIIVRAREHDDMKLVQDRIEKALADASQTPLSAERLDAIKSHLRYEFAGSLDTPDTVALAVCYSIAVTGRADSMNDLYESYNAVTPSDLQRVASRYFTPKNRTIVTLESEPTK